MGVEGKSFIWIAHTIIKKKQFEMPSLVNKAQVVEKQHQKCFFKYGKIKMNMNILKFKESTLKCNGILNFYDKPG